MNRQRSINIIAAGGLLFAGIALCFAQNAHAQQPPATPSPGTRLFAAFDTNHDGMLSAQEFTTGYAGLQRATELTRRMHAQFVVLDADKSGALDDREYAGLLLIKQAGKSAPPMSAFDANGDHALNFAEYAGLVRKLAPVRARY